MRTALCFSGELRSIDKCLPFWKKQIFPKIGDFDSFYFGWDDDPEFYKLKFLDKVNAKRNVTSTLLSSAKQYLKI